MNPKLSGEVTLIFINGGLSKSGRPYLRCSNGRAEIFISLPKDFDESVLDNYSEDDEITMEVSVTVGSDQVKLERVID